MDVRELWDSAEGDGRLQAAGERVGIAQPVALREWLTVAEPAAV